MSVGAEGEVVSGSRVLTTDGGAGWSPEWVSRCRDRWLPVIGRLVWRDRSRGMIGPLAWRHHVTYGLVSHL